ncbi:hypothetical protein F7725_009605, partial [Dissostichus mawsoni]
MQDAEESEGEASMSSLPDCTIKVLTKHQKSAKKRDAVIHNTEESEGEASMSSLPDCTRKVLKKHQKSVKKRGKQMVVKRIWTSEEIAAVERHLRRWIIMNQVPGKEACEDCISAEPQALSNRDWRAVISALR